MFPHPKEEINERETQEHVLLICEHTKPVLDLVLDSWENAANKKMQERGHQTVVNMHPNTGLAREQQIAFMILASTYKQAAWQGRNIMKYEGRKITAEWILQSFQIGMGKRKKLEREDRAEKVLGKAVKEMAQTTMKELQERKIKK